MTSSYLATPYPSQAYPDINYDPGLLDPAGFGQGPDNPAPPIFYESLATTQDMSVMGSNYVAKTHNVQGDIIGLANQQLAKNLQVGGLGSFGGIVSAAGFTYGGKSFFGSNQFIVEAPATFLNSLATNGASSFGGLLSAATGIVSQTLAINPQFNQNQQQTPQNQANYQPRDADGNPINTPIPFVPCTIGQLPANAVVLAYVPYIEPT